MHKDGPRQNVICMINSFFGCCWRRLPRLSHRPVSWRLHQILTVQVPHKICSMCFKHRGSQVAARIHEEATWFCSRVGSLFTSSSQPPNFFVISFSFFFPYLLLKGEMQLCSKFVLGWSQERNSDCSSPTTNTKGCSIFATRFKIKCSFYSEILLGWGCWNLQCINFLIDSLSWFKFHWGDRKSVV